MNKTAKVLVAVIVGIAVTACEHRSSDSKGQQRQETKEPWMKTDFSLWPQILLTNSYEFKHRTIGLGASSFLLRSEKDTFMCTAKHLLGSGMGVEPEVPADSVNVLLENWLIYPRSNEISSDTLKVVKLVSLTKSEKDIMLFEIEKEHHDIQPLKPNFKKLRLGELVQIIGCEYATEHCRQDMFKASIYSYEEGKILLQAIDNFVVAGFSGAPAVDKNGHVIGVLSGGGEYEGVMILVLEPIGSIKKWI